LPLPAQSKRVHKEWWRVDEGSKENRIFIGSVKSIKGAIVIIMATPENFEATYWQTHIGPEPLKVGDKVSFTVAFNAYGAHARAVRPSK